MVIYLDITFANNFLMTLAIIWAVGHILELEVSWKRLTLAALVGTVYLFVFLYLNLLYLPWYLKYPLHIILNLLVALSMIKLAYGSLKRKLYRKGVIYLYVISFLTIGTILSIYYINGSTPFKSGQLLLVITGLLVLLIIGNYGWQLVQEYITPEQFYLPVEVFMDKKSLRLTGLIDTGNSLTDPLTKVPVLVVDLQEIKQLFSSKLQEELLDSSGDEFNLIDLFTQEGMGNRVRILPFSGLGQEHGLLVGLRPDKVRIIHQEQIIESDRIILGLSKQKLDEEGQYQILIHPKTIKLQV